MHLDLRQTPRFPIEQEVNLVILSNSPICSHATVRDASGDGLGLVSPIAVPCGAAVKIEFDDSIFLGEATYCKAIDAGYAVGIQLNQVLSGVTALARATKKFTDQMDPAFADRP